MALTLTLYLDVRQALTDDRLTPPPPGPADPAPTLAWLRASVARFSSGEIHARRRRLVQADLERLDPSLLREQAAAATKALLPEGGSVRDAVARVAQTVPVDVVASALGMPKAAAAVTVVAKGYLTGEADRETDDAVATLVGMLGGETNEAVANRIGLLVQACAATAALIRNTVEAGLRAPGRRVEDLLTETLRLDPPVQGTRRVAQEATRIGETLVAAGMSVTLDFVTASHDACITFGAGTHGCPGRDQAVAIASGVVESLFLNCEVPGHEIGSAPNKH